MCPQSRKKYFQRFDFHEITPCHLVSPYNKKLFVASHIHSFGHWSTKIETHSAKDNMSAQLRRLLLNTPLFFAVPKSVSFWVLNLLCLAAQNYPFVNLGLQQ